MTSRRAFSWRWGGYLALAVACFALCVGLGVWQLGRRDEALSEISRVRVNFDREPVALDHALAELGDFDSSQKWLPVRLSGSYVPGAQLLARLRPHDGRVGFDVIAPFRTDGGAVFVVDRGWLPTGLDGDIPDAVPQPPEGKMTVVARLRAGEPSVNRSAPEGQIPTINLENIRDHLNEPTYTGAYGLLADEDPAPDTRPAEVGMPTADEGPHLSYAFQWFFFSVLGFVGLGYAFREEGRTINAIGPAGKARVRERERPRSARRSDAEIEDEILNARSAATRAK